MFYKVRDPICAVSNVDDYSASARLLAATTLRNVLGTKSLKEILSDRENIARDMQECTNTLQYIIRELSKVSVLGFRTRA